MFAHRSADLADGPLMLRARQGVRALAERLEADPGTLQCLRDNRRNRLKMLVSCYATLLRLQLALGDAVALRELGRAGLMLMQRLDPAAIDANTSYRLTRNSCRVLSIAALEAVDKRDPDLLAAVSDAMEAQHLHIHTPCFDNHPAQEDHRRFVSLMLEAVRAMAPSLQSGLDSTACDALETVMVLVIKSERDLQDQQRCLRSLDQAHQLFASFWSSPPACPPWL